MSIDILAAKATSPESDGDARFEVSIVFTNCSPETIELLHTRLLVSTPDGTPLGESEEDIEELIPPGDTGKISISTYRIPYPLDTVTDAKLTVTIVPMSCTYLDLGKLEIPIEANGLTTSLHEIQSDGLVVKSWSCLRRRSDRDGDVTIEGNALINNQTGMTLHRSVLKLQVFNYSGRPVNDTESRDDRLLCNGIPALINDSIYCKSSQLKGGLISATLRCFRPLKPEYIDIQGLQLDR